MKISIERRKSENQSVMKSIGEAYSEK